MSCTLVFRCDHCGDEVLQEPLAGNHPELRVRVAYPDGWDFDSDGDAMCPACTEKNAEPPAAQEAPQEAQA